MADGYAEGVLDLLKPRLGAIPGVENVVLRSLNSVDVNGTLGISVDAWEPLIWEMAGEGSLEPAIQRYTFSIQHFVKWGTQEEGERIHREVAKAVRLMLYRDPELQVSLRTLFVQDGPRKERTQKYTVTDQRYAKNEAGPAFLFLSVTDFAVETETVTTL